MLVPSSDKYGWFATSLRTQAISFVELNEEKTANRGTVSRNSEAKTFWEKSERNGRAHVH